MPVVYVRRRDRATGCVLDGAVAALISPPGLERLFAAVAERGEEALLADPEQLVALAAEHGTEVLGDYPGS